MRFIRYEDLLADEQVPLSGKLTDSAHTVGAHALKHRIG